MSWSWFLLRKTGTEGFYSAWRRVAHPDGVGLSPPFLEHKGIHMSFHTRTLGLLAIAGCASTMAAACSSTPSTKSAEQTATSASAIDYTVFPPTTYQITLASVKFDTNNEPWEPLMGPRSPYGSGPYEGQWTPDTGNIAWAELGYRLNSDTNAITTACSLGPVVEGSVVSNCKPGATVSGPFNAGQPLSIFAQVTKATDVVNLGVSLNNIESTSPGQLTSESSAAPTAQQEFKDIGTVVTILGSAGMPYVGAIAFGLSVAENLLTSDDGSGEDPNKEITCAGGLMGAPSTPTGAPADSLVLRFTPTQLEELTKNGTGSFDYDTGYFQHGYTASPQFGPLCGARVQLHFTVTRDWSSGLAVSPKSGDSATATDQEIDQFSTTTTTTPRRVNHQYWNGSAWKGQSAGIPEVSTADPSPAFEIGQPIATINRTEQTVDALWVDSGGVVTWSPSNMAEYPSNPENRYSTAIAYKAPAYANVSVASRSPSSLDAFYIGTDGGLQYLAYGGSTWSSSEVAPPGSSQPGGGVAAVARTPNDLDVFFIGKDGALWRSAWTSAAGWSTGSVSPAQTGLAPAGARLAAVASTVGNLDVFFLGNNGRMWSSSWVAGAPAFVTSLVPLIDGTAPGSTISAVSRQPGLIDVAFTSHGNVYDATETNGAWTLATVMNHGASASPTFDLSIVAPTSWSLDIFFHDWTGQVWQDAWSYGTPGWSLNGPLGFYNGCVESCADAGATCGTVPDGCGGALNCGACAITSTPVCLSAPTPAAKKERADLASVWDYNNEAATAMFESTSSAFAYPGQWLIDGGWDNATRWLAGDVTGDGLADTVAVWNDNGTNAIAVRKSTGTSLVELGQWALNVGPFNDSNVWLPGDFNGDGMVDIARAVDDGGTTTIHVLESTGSSFGPPTLWANQQAWWEAGANWVTGDFNGDGKADIATVWSNAGSTMITERLSTSTSFTPTTYAMDYGGWTSGASWLPGDYNGDGKTDLAAVSNSNATTSVGVYLSTGAGFNTRVQWPTQGGWAGGMWASGDFNGDGLTDIANAWDANSTAAIAVRLSQNGSFPVSTWSDVGGFMTNTAWCAAKFH